MTTDERLARLERENRCMQLGGVVLLLALVAVLLVAAGQEKEKPKVLEEVMAKKFYVIGENGKIRGSWNATDLFIGCRTPSEIQLAATSVCSYLLVGDKIGISLVAEIDGKRASSCCSKWFVSRAPSFRSGSCSGNPFRISDSSRFPTCEPWRKDGALGAKHLFQPERSGAWGRGLGITAERDEARSF